MSHSLRQFLVCFFLIIAASPAMAQPVWTIDPFGSKKPKEYAERKLPSEKTGDRKLNGARKFVQNATSRYNYYFNAEQKLQNLLDRTASGTHEDYNELLSFYPYTLEQTARERTELDSVIYKATSGILLHDLRTDWVDNFYLLIGKAYYYRNELDSAQLTFQFINYNLFPREKGEDYNRIIGTRTEENGSTNMSIANAEKQTLLKRVTGLPPSRNDALIWLARTFIAKKEYGDAAGLINILSTDKNLPKRLQADLQEVKAYLNFSQGIYDSSALFLTRSLDAADSKTDQGRREYLAAQMFERSGDFDKASTYYKLAAKHTVDPELEIFAKVYDAKMLRHQGDQAELKKTVDNLQAMARKDRYEDYRDIIYYNLAGLNLMQPDTLSGINSYLSSIKSLQSKRPYYRNMSYRDLANLAYQSGDYRRASGYYDSLNFSDPVIIRDSAALYNRKLVLGNLVEQINIIERQDSLQRIALLAPADRDAYIRRLIRERKRSQGLKDTSTSTPVLANPFAAQNTKGIFGNAPKGDWYFYNRNLVSRGTIEFTSKWGRRENVDNWRTVVPMTTSINQTPMLNDPNNPLASGSLRNRTLVDDYSFESMSANLPLTTGAIDTSNAMVMAALLQEAAIFRDELQDYGKARQAYMEYLRRFEKSGNNEAAYYGLYVSNTRMGDEAAATFYKNQLSGAYPTAITTQKVLHPENFVDGGKNSAVATLYTEIYNTFLAGNCSEAYRLKRNADSVHGTIYWTPQLLYIEALCHVKNQQDSLALISLNDLISRYPNTPLQEKALVMKDVLSRKDSIVNYLSNLEVTRTEEDVLINSGETKTNIVAVHAPRQAPQVVALPGRGGIVQPKLDTMNLLRQGAFMIRAEEPHMLVMRFNKVDPTFVREARLVMERFAATGFPDQKITIASDRLDEDNILTFNVFPTAFKADEAVDVAKRVSAAQISFITPDRYSFFIASPENLQLLKSGKGFSDYKNLLNRVFKGRY